MILVLKIAAVLVAVAAGLVLSCWIIAGRAEERAQKEGHFIQDV